MTWSGLRISMSALASMSPALTTPGPSFFSTMRLRPSACMPERDLLDVEDDVGHVLAHAGDRRELVQHAVDLHRGDRGALERRQQHAAQRVAERHAEAALERLGHQRRNPPGRGPDDLELACGLMSSCQFFCSTWSCPFLVHERGSLPQLPRHPRQHVPAPSLSVRRGGACGGRSRYAGSASRRGSR